MRYAKLIGRLAVGVAALMAFAGTASATTLTNSIQQSFGVGTVFHATSEGVVRFDGSIEINCQKSIIEGVVSSAGGPGEEKTVSAPISVLTLEECGSSTLLVINKGSFEIHTESPSTSNDNGTITWSGAELTLLRHLPFSVTVHCVYVTTGIDIGTLTGSGNTGNTATFHESAPVGLRMTDFGCGSAAQWTGSYSINVPDYLDVD